MLRTDNKVDHFQNFEVKTNLDFKSESIWSIQFYQFHQWIFLAFNLSVRFFRCIYVLIKFIDRSTKLKKVCIISKVINLTEAWLELNLLTDWNCFLRRKTWIIQSEDHEHNTWTVLKFPRCPQRHHLLLSNNCLSKLYISKARNIEWCSFKQNYQRYMKSVIPIILKKLQGLLYSLFLICYHLF